MTETWLPVPGFPHYEVSDLGRVRSLPRVIQQRHACGKMMNRRIPGGVLKQNPDTDGYLGVNLYADNVMHPSKVHRLVLLVFVGPKPEGMQGCHGDGNRQNNSLANLRYGTPLENSADAVRHDTLAHSERSPRAKLTRNDVAFIRAERGRTRQIDLAAAFNVPQSDISAIQLRKVWRHV